MAKGPVSRPTNIPVLPLPYPLVLLPGARLTIPISQDIGEALLTLLERTQNLPVVAAVPAVSPNEKENDRTPPKYATATRILRLVRPARQMADGDKPVMYLASVHGLTRVNLEEPYDANKALSSPPQNRLEMRNVSYPSPHSLDQEQDVIALRDGIVKFKASALKVLGHLMQNSQHQQAKRDAYAKVAAMLEELRAPLVDEDTEKMRGRIDENQETLDRAAWMADLLVGSVLPVGGSSAENEEWGDKFALLQSPTPLARLNLSTNILNKLHTKLEVTSRIAHAVDESLSKQQKEFFLRQQMRAIEKELRDLQQPSQNPQSQVNSTDANSNRGIESQKNSELDLDQSPEAEDAELSEIKRKIEAMEPGSEERKAGVREWRRYRRLTGSGGPGGGMSVEGSVIRGWLEWFTALPWAGYIPSPSPSTNSDGQLISTRGFLAAAREQLDKDHYGLDKIKKRLIEYLAVVRLNELARAAEDAREREQELSASIPKIEAPEEKKSTPENMQLVLRKPDMPPPAPSQALGPKRKRRAGVKGPILLFNGPPGTGKTSLGQSIARALNKPFQRISLGGVRDEGEIRGHRRTYVASGPGLIVQALRKAGRPDFVCLLDEIDKVGGGGYGGGVHGDPSAALLEVLDPEQNSTFMDHYIGVPVDLSQILFICTSNNLEIISGPLLDRCEVVVLPGYTYDEKNHIAHRFLLPKQVKANGMETPPTQSPLVDITEDAFRTVAMRYTREAGVRTLERHIGAIVRYKAVEWAEAMETHEDEGYHGPESDYSDPNALMKATHSTRSYNPVVTEADLETILGIARWDEEEEGKDSRILRKGVVYGLVVMGQGEGGILPVEAVSVPNEGKEGGRLKLTGSLGDVIKESAELALSWVKMRAWESGISVGFGGDIHVHLPAGAQKKDGPSAGVTMTCALVSLLTGACVPTDIAMTGEITLRGRVTPVGGIKEKVLGAHRAQMRKLILPYGNRKDVDQDVAPEIRRQMEFVFVRTLEETLEAAFGKGVLFGMGWGRSARDGQRVRLHVESRL
ncbi:hypothetical protein E1B28_013408 [Marasmius oreades]|uniref:Lon proteolytic domain-containing protein n=1 Tax=Marasmius oreades TaxID=181124 RepID=A0A9P7RQ54_9AGAR|nr:uncharacterized protein E1B28_013408 [Marasmius oreades]KAG7087442.1 hypothetical protein E1B28_013408 [Marasmius oreades]